MEKLQLYLPVLIASLLTSIDPHLGYWSSWLGSLILFRMAFSPSIAPLPDGAHWSTQLLRPRFLPHLVFAGYMCVTSVFYYFDAAGYYYFSKINEPVSLVEFEYIAKAQLLYLFGHTGLLHGILLAEKKEGGSAQFIYPNTFTSLLRLSILFLALALLCRFVPGFSQFTVKFNALYSIAVMLMLPSALASRNLISIGVAFFLFVLSVFSAITSGYKEDIIFPVLVIGALFYPKYKTAVITLGIPLLLLLFFLLPTFVSTFRELAWNNKVNSTEATKAALNALKTEDQTTFRESNWIFLTNRLSEMNTFIIYLHNVPQQRPYYQFQIVQQSLLSILPRALYPTKPDMEFLVMQRVRENRVIEDYSTSVSVKPQLVVDGYLSFGFLGAWLFCALAGWFSSRIASWCERIFGGYFFGVGLFYMGLFGIFLRGNALEFMVSSIFWSWITALILRRMLRLFNKNLG